MALLIRCTDSKSAIDPKSEWFVCVLELVGLVVCMAITTLLLANLIDKRIYYNQFKYADEYECAQVKTSTDKRPIASPWCLLLLRHRINKTNKTRQRRHTLPTLDFMHWKLNEPPSYVEPKFFGQRVRLRNFDTVPSWTNGQQTRPLFETPGIHAQPFKHVDEMVHTPAPPLPSTETENAVNQHSRIFNHTVDPQLPVHSVETVATTTHISLITYAPVEQVQVLQTSQPIQMLQTTQPIQIIEETTQINIDAMPQQIEGSVKYTTTVQPIIQQMTQTVAQPLAQPVESIVSSKLGIQSQPVQTMEIQPSSMSQIESQQTAHQTQDQLPSNDPLLAAVHESISDPLAPQSSPTRYIRYRHA